MSERNIGDSGSDSAGDSAGGLNEAGGCSVDWRWLVGEQVASVTNGLDRLTIRFVGGTTFTTRALMWQGKPFLSFEPVERPAQGPVSGPHPDKP